MDPWLTPAERAGKKTMWNACVMNMKGNEKKSGKKTKHRDHHAKGKENVGLTEWSTPTGRAWRTEGLTQKTKSKMMKGRKPKGRPEEGKGLPIIPTGPPGGKKIWLHQVEKLQDLHANKGSQAFHEKGIPSEKRQDEEGNRSSEHHAEEMGQATEAPMTEDSYEILSMEPITENTGNQENLSTTEEG